MNNTESTAPESTALELPSWEPANSENALSNVDVEMLANGAYYTTNPEAQGNTTSTTSATANDYYTTRLDAPPIYITKPNPNRRHSLEGHNVIENYKGIGKKANEAVLAQIAKQKQELERRRWERPILQAADAISAELRPTKGGAYDDPNPDQIKLTKEEFSGSNPETNAPNLGGGYVVRAATEAKPAAETGAEIDKDKEPGPLGRFMRKALANPKFQKVTVAVAASLLLSVLSGCSNDESESTAPTELTIETGNPAGSHNPTQAPETERTQEKIGIIDGYNEAGMYLSEGKASPLNFACASEVAEACGSNDPREIVKYVAKNQVGSFADYLVHLPEEKQPDGIKGLTLKGAEEYLESLSDEEYQNILQQFNSIIDEADVNDHMAIGRYANAYMSIKPESLVDCLMSLPEEEQPEVVRGVPRDKAINNLKHLNKTNYNSLFKDYDSQIHNYYQEKGLVHDDVELVYAETNEFTSTKLFSWESTSWSMEVKISQDEDGHYGYYGNCTQIVTPITDGTPSVYDGLEKIPAPREELTPKSVEAEMGIGGKLSPAELNEEETPLTSLDDLERARAEAERERQEREAAEQAAAEQRAREQAEAEAAAKAEAERRAAEAAAKAEAERRAAEAAAKAEAEAAAAQAAANAEAERRAAEAAAAAAAQEAADQRAREQAQEAEEKSTNDEDRDAEDWANGEFDLPEPEQP